MAAPVRASTTVTKGTATNTATLNLPATIAAGDRLVAFVVVDDDGTITSNPSDSTGDAWTTPLASTTLTASNPHAIAIFEKIADGDEDSGTLNVVHNGGSEAFLGFVVRCTGAHASQALEVSTVSDDADGDPDPAELTASWGAEDNLFIAFIAPTRINSLAAPTPPTGYTLNTTQGTDWDATGTGDQAQAVGAVASKAVTATAADDPGAWDWEAFGSLAVTVVLRPADAAPSAALTGTVSPTATEAEIVAGGQTAILTLTNDTWVASGATFDAQRQAIIDGFDSAQSELTGWNAEVRDKEAVTAVVRTSDTVVTVTFTAAAAYAITATETITITVPADALVTSSDPVVADDTFNVLPDPSGGARPAGINRGLINNGLINGGLIR